MNLIEAKTLIRQGYKFGDVFPNLMSDADRDELRRAFCRGELNPPSPVKMAVSPTVGETHTNGKPPVKRQKAERPTGDCCFKCGGSNIQRTGTCETCYDCGESQGGCG